MIKHLDPIYCQIKDKSLIDPVFEILSYTSSRWRPGRFSKVEVKDERSFLDKRNGRFLAGFYTRVMEELDRRKLLSSDDFANMACYNAINHVIFKKPNLPGITLRQDQLDMLQALSGYQRGVFKAPTGSGKTILAAAIRSMLPDSMILFLCHTIDLLSQAADEFRKFGFNVIEVGGGEKNIPELKPGDVVVSTVQTWVKLPLLTYCETFDAIIIDEVHHVASRDGRYAYILERSLAPIRIGLTATLPIEKVKLLTLEGYIGPVIGEFTLEEGIKQGILATPMIEWISVPIEDELLKHEKYKDIYEHCIVNNRTRNRLIMTEAFAEIQEGHSVLILVKEIEHGNNLQKMGEIIGVETEFVWGKTKKDVRKETKIALEKKEIKCVIASTTWNEGINIKSLDIAINAAGGKSELTTLQKIGRGLRTTPTKTQVVIKDFVDGYKYLSHHTMMRLRTYVENKWSMKGVR